MNNKITQQERLLKELWKGKVNSYLATYSLRIKQAPTRIKELRDKGFNIISITKSDKSVDWILQNKKIEPVYKWDFEGSIARQVPVNQKLVQEVLI